VWASHSFILFWFEMTQSTIQTFNSNNTTIIIFTPVSLLNCSIEVLRRIVQYNSCHLRMSPTQNGIFYGFINVFVCLIAAQLLHLCSACNIVLCSCPSPLYQDFVLPVLGTPKTALWKAELEKVTKNCKMGNFCFYKNNFILLT
jgi:hypothetical protein